MRAVAVAERLGLGDDYHTWLESLEALGPPPDEGMRLPSTEDAPALMRRLGVVENDLADILAAWPSPTAKPEFWWLLERAYHGIRQDIGVFDTMRPMRSLPADLGTQGRLFWVFVYLAAVDDIRRWHQERGIPDEISWATLADLGQHIRLTRRRTGCVGLDAYWWPSLHFRGALFALGRLQFNPYRLRTGPEGPLFWYDAETVESLGDGFRPGAPVLGVHIPETGPMTPSACDASFRAAREFFPEHLPEQSSRIATCTSWLLDEQLADYLDPDSNIVRFQRRFQLVPGAREADYSPLQFIFSRGLEALAELKPRTTLEKALVKHLQDGGHWYMRTGWLAL